MNPCDLVPFFCEYIVLVWDLPVALFILIPLLILAFWVVIKLPLSLFN